MTAEDELNYAIGYVGALPSKYPKLREWAENLETHLKFALIDVDKLRQESEALKEEIVRWRQEALSQQERYLALRDSF